MKPTLTEAKNRYNAHTRHVLTNEAKKELQKYGEWLVIDDYPVIRSSRDNRLMLSFYKDDLDHIFCKPVRFFTDLDEPIFEPEDY